MHLLLEKGANINAASKTGSTSLMLGVRHNSHDALRLLLREEAFEYDGENIKGRSVLDYAALHGDIDTIHILQTSPRMKTVDLNGSRALNYAKWRIDDNEAHSLWSGQALDKDSQLQYSAFKAFWNSIAEAQQLDIEEDSDAEPIEEEGTDNDEEQSAEEEQTDDEEQSTEDDEQIDNDNDDNDDDDDDGKNSELWVDAPESSDGSTK